MTFAKGIVRGAHSFDRSRSLTDRLAGGAIVSYELGLAALEMLDCEFPHVTKALLTDALTFKDTIVKDSLNTFTHTDNSESPALVKTVRLTDFQFSPEAYTEPANPHFRIRAKLQVEPP